jgi:monoamine oxidase
LSRIRRRKTGSPDAVVVLGAGVAGLAAGVRLAEAGVGVDVLEARDRAGGRVWSQEVPGCPRPVEFGAEFVHGEDRGFERLLHRSGLQAKKVRPAMWWCADGRVRRLEGGWERLDALFGRIPRDARDFGHWLGRAKARPVDAALARAFVHGFDAAPLDRMSAPVLRSSVDEGHAIARLDGAYSELVARLVADLQAAGGRLWLRTPVGEVGWRPSRVRVSALAGGRTWTARAAVVALPLGVLKFGDVRFRPGLAAREPALDAVEPGHVVRVTFWLWPDAWAKGPIPAALRARQGRAFGFLQSARDEFPVWWAHAPHPVLVGWTGGPAARRLGALPDEVIAQRALRALASLLGRTPSQMRDLVVSWHLHNWTADPFSRGGYSYATAGAEAAPSLLAQPLEDTLFFAGEHTAGPQLLGTVPGALGTGQRAATEVLRALRLA